MMFTEIPTEQTTAVTDGFIAFTAVCGCIYFKNLGRLYERWRAQMWAGVFFMLAIASILGTAAHGLKIAESTRSLLWHPLNLTLGLSIALFVTSVIYDGWGLAASRRVLGPMLGAATGFFLLASLNPDTFLVFIVFQALATLFAVAVYWRLGHKRELDGAWLITAGILTTILAGLIQANRGVFFTLIWQFDHNGAYHLVQLPALILLMLGVRAPWRKGIPANDDAQ